MAGAKIIDESLAAMAVIPFSGNPLDRASEKRSDADWIAAQRRDPDALVWPLWRLQPFLLGPENRDAASVEAAYLRPGLAEEIEILLDG